MMCQLVIVYQLFMVLINGHGAALMSSQAHVKPNKKGMLGAFVTILVITSLSYNSNYSSNYSNLIVAIIVIIIAVIIAIS